MDAPPGPGDEDDQHRYAPSRDDHAPDRRVQPLPPGAMGTVQEIVVLLLQALPHFLNRIYAQHGEARAKHDGSGRDKPDARRCLGRLVVL